MNRQTLLRLGTEDAFICCEQSLPHLLCVYALLYLSNGNNFNDCKQSTVKCSVPLSEIGLLPENSLRETNAV